MTTKEIKPIGITKVLAFKKFKSHNRMSTVYIYYLVSTGVMLMLIQAFQTMSNMCDVLAQFVN